MQQSKVLCTLVNSRDKALSDCVMSLLCQIITVLANTKLNISERENQLILDGWQYLPADLTKWFLLLGQRLPSKIYYAVLVYFYFVLLCAKSFEKTSKYHQVLCIFMKSQTSPISPAMLKAVWFIFAVSSLSQHDSQRRKKEVEVSANSILIRWLQAVPLSSVYTHHPALLFWTFSPNVTNKTLQINLMTLWLKSTDEPSKKELRELVLNNRKAVYCLLDVLIDCTLETIPILMDILKMVLNRDKSEGLPESSDSIWSNLPRTLTILTTPHQQNKVNNVSCMVFLACKLVPTRPDVVLLLRISYQLLLLLRRPIKDHSMYTVLHAQLFKLANILVIKMNQVKDYRVLELFLQDKVLLRAILTSLNSEINIVILPALTLISYLQYFQKLYNIKVNSTMYVSGATLLELMNSPRGENKLASLNLFSMLHSTNKLRPVVALSTTTADNILQALFLDFQTMTLKSNESWNCLTLLLEFCEANNPKLELHLLTQPWTFLIIQLAIDKKNMNSPEVLLFLKGWLKKLLTRKVVPKISYSRALCQDRLSNTLTLVANEVLQKYQPDNNFNNLYLDIASKITKIGANIPQQVFQSLDERILQKYIIW